MPYAGSRRVLGCLQGDLAVGLVVLQALRARDVVHSAEEKIRIVLEGLRGESGIAARPTIINLS